MQKEKGAQKLVVAYVTVKEGINAANVERQRLSHKSAKKKKKSNYTKNPCLKKA